MLVSLVEHKYLIRELVSRDLRLRYLGSIIGVFWSILNPLVQLLLYTIIFSLVLKTRFGTEASAGHFAEYLFCALLPWMALQESITRSSRTFIENANLIRKVRFPLHVLPFSIVVSAFVHQFLGTGVFVLILIFYQRLNLEFFTLVFLAYIFQLLLAYGLSLAVASLNVFFRDIAQILGVIFMLFFWITPIVYPRSLAPPPFSWVLAANPLTHMVELYRFFFLGDVPPSWLGVAWWLLFCVLSYFFGRMILSRTRRELVDLI